MYFYHYLDNLNNYSMICLDFYIKNPNVLMKIMFISLFCLPELLLSWCALFMPLQSPVYRFYLTSDIRCNKGALLDLYYWLEDKKPPWIDIIRSEILHPRPVNISIYGGFSSSNICYEQMDTNQISSPCWIEYVK